MIILCSAVWKDNLWWDINICQIKQISSHFPFSKRIPHGQGPFRKGKLSQFAKENGKPPLALALFPLPFSLNFAFSSPWLSPTFVFFLLERTFAFILSEPKHFPFRTNSRFLSGTSFSLKIFNFQSTTFTEFAHWKRCWFETTILLLRTAWQGDQE